MRSTVNRSSKTFFRSCTHLPYSSANCPECSLPSFSDHQKNNFLDPSSSLNLNSSTTQSSERILKKNLSKRLRELIISKKKLTKKTKDLLLKINQYYVESIKILDQQISECSGFIMKRKLLLDDYKKVNLMLSKNLSSEIKPIEECSRIILKNSKIDEVLNCDFEINTEEELSSLAIDKTGEFLVTGSKLTIKNWKIESKSALKCFPTNNFPVHCLIYNKKFDTFITGHELGWVAIWDFSSSSLISQKMIHFDSVLALCLTNDCERIFSCSKDTAINLSQYGTLNVILSFPGHLQGVNCISLSPDNFYLVSGSDDSFLKVWNLEVNVFDGNLQGNTGKISAVAFSQDGFRVVSGAEDCIIRVWKLNLRSLLYCLSGHSNWIRSVAFVFDDSFVVSGGDDGKIHVWDTNEQRCVLSLSNESKKVRCVTLDHQGEWIYSVVDDKFVRGWIVKDKIRSLDNLDD